MSPKKVLGLYRNQSPHWVGDGFPVRNLFPSNDLGESISPFLLLDYAGPKVFEPTHKPRGVDEHPHRGFETVTIVYQGALEHRDSSGNSGTIFPGDVQWMTAASGVVHEEKHETEFTRKGGAFEVIQLWVNLPAAQKMSAPRYQPITADQIPEVEIPSGGKVRIIAGSYESVTGPAHTVSPINLWDVRMSSGSVCNMSLPEGWNAAVFVLSGNVTINGREATDAELVLLDRPGTELVVQAPSEATMLLLNGEPINEPVAMYGPFVMNTQDELRQAMEDFRSGKMGRLD